MTPLIFASLFACRQDFSYAVNLTDSAPLPDLDVACAPSDDQLTREDTVVFSRVAAADDQGVPGCEAAVVAVGPLLAWVDAKAEMNQYNVDLDGWTSADAVLRSLLVTTSDGGVAPAGSFVTATQLLLDEDQAAAVIAGDAFAEADQILTTKPEQLLLSFDYQVEGGEDDLADLVSIARRGTQPTAVLDRSYSHDEALQMVTIASVVVPSEALAEFPVTGLSLDFDEGVTVDGTVCAAGGCNMADFLWGGGGRQ